MARSEVLWANGVKRWQGVGMSSGITASVRPPCKVLFKGTQAATQ